MSSERALLIPGENGADAAEKGRTGSKDSDDDSEGKDAEVPAGYGGIYTSVLMAMGGHVKVEGKEGSPVHPVSMLVLCVPIFLVQVVAMMYLRSDLPIERDFYKPNDEASTSLLKLKWLMVCILYLSNYKKIQVSVHHIIFALNPLTWVEVERPQTAAWMVPGWLMELSAKCGHFFLEWTLQPAVLMALLMKFTTNYLVCVESVSIILSADHPKDIIFNGLAVTFVSDLGETWWDFVSHTFHFKSIEGDEAKFKKKPWNKVWKNYDKLQVDSATGWFFEFVAKWTSTTRAGKQEGNKDDKVRSWLSIGYGANRVMRCLSTLILFSIFGRQLFVMLHAIDSRRLPVARDLCKEYRISQGKATMFGFGVKVPQVVNDTFVTEALGIEEQLEKFDRHDVLRYDCLYCLDNVLTNQTGDDGISNLTVEHLTPYYGQKIYDGEYIGPDGTVHELKDHHCLGPLSRVVEYGLARKYKEIIIFAAAAGTSLLLLPMMVLTLECCEGQCSRVAYGAPKQPASQTE